MIGLSTDAREPAKQPMSTSGMSFRSRVCSVQNSVAFGRMEDGHDLGVIYFYAHVSYLVPLLGSFTYCVRCSS